MLFQLLKSQFDPGGVRTTKTSMRWCPSRAHKQLESCFEKCSRLSESETLSRRNRRSLPRSKPLLPCKSKMLLENRSTSENALAFFPFHADADARLARRLAELNKEGP